MTITCDPAKRQWTIDHRGLDFMDAERVFAGRTLTLEDDRKAYGETRFLTFGTLRDRLVVVVWTPRGADRHVISMRRCNDREERKVLRQLR